MASLIVGCRSLVLLLLCIGSACISAQNAPRTYIVHKLDGTLQIDGRATEESWEKAQWSSDFIDIEGIKTPKYKTRVKMLWDDEHIYFLATLQEPHIWGTLKKRDTVIFYNNDFEIFIDPDGDTHNYMEFEINALNTVWDLFLTKPYRNGPKVLDSWDIQGVETAIHIDGTLNNPNDVDSEWSIEISMPWSVLGEANTHNKIPVNEFWRLNFSRVNWDFELENGRYMRKKDADGAYLPEYNWVWSPQGVINMHEPEHWGYVYFTDEKPGEETGFSIPKDEQLKWYLYEVFRDMMDEDKRKLIFGSGDTIVEGASKEIQGKTVVPVLEDLRPGFRISVLSPFTNRKLMITDDGRFKSYDK